MEKFIQLGKEFGLEGEKLLEFVCEQEEKEEKHSQLKEEKEERRREEEREEEHREEEREKKHRQQLEEEERAERQRREEEGREQRPRRQDEEREARHQGREIRKLQQQAYIMRQKEAAGAAKRERELELARLAATNGDGCTTERDDSYSAKTSSVRGW